MITNELMYFILFCLLITVVLVIDLKIIGRSSHTMSFKEALIWTAIWITMAFLFFLFLSFHGERIHGITTMQKLVEIRDRFAPHLVLTGNLQESIELYRNNISTEYLTGYLIEYTLSMDNIFVIMTILSAFSVNEKYYKRVLFWGILGAVILRCLFIFAGAALIHKFAWVLFIFGGFLVFSGVKMFIERNKDNRVEPQKHWLVKFLSRNFSVFPRFVRDHFFVFNRHKVYITPLFIILILVEFTDLIFAFDSIPAIFAITMDPYVVFFSNIFAIIGLRSLFFLLIKIIHLFRFLKTGISVLLVFIGIKLLAHNWLDQINFKTIYSLYFILSVIVVSILASVFIPKKNTVNV
jgi:tellurite resistance protein TerC